MEENFVTVVMYSGVRTAAAGAALASPLLEQNWVRVIIHMHTHCTWSAVPSAFVDVASVSMSYDVQNELRCCNFNFVRWDSPLRIFFLDQCFECF